jgi:phage replication O-like protein O
MKELKPNFTQIPNIILDQYITTLDSDTFKVLMIFCRKIYGYHKKDDRIAQSQIVQVSGLTLKMVRKGIRILIERKILAVVGRETRTKARRYKLILCDIREDENFTLNNDLPNNLRGSHGDPLEVPSGNLGGALRESHEVPSGNLQNKKKETNINIFLNKEQEYKKNIANEISIKEYVVNNNVGSVKPQGITNQINEWFITLWKEYYKMPYKADLFETERLAHELNHDWESFLIIVKSYQSDPYWAKISMSPKMIRKAWDKLGSRAKVSEEQMREVRKMEIDTYEKKLLEHEQHKKELKQTADNWKPWNLKEDFEKMIGGK